MKRRKLTIVEIFVVAGIVALLLSCLGLPIVDVPAMLIVGWLLYLARVLPKVTVNWAGVGSAVLSLAGMLILAQMLGRWLWRETVSPASQMQQWKWRWNCAFVAIVTLMFTSGIAAIGVTHQTAWLVRSEERMFEFGGSREKANRVRCASNMREIGFMIRQYADSHDGHLPDTIEELASVNELSGSSYVCPSSNLDYSQARRDAELVRELRSGGEHNTYVYLGRGLRFPLPADRIILTEPLLDHDGVGMNLMYANFDIVWKTPADAAKELARLTPVH